MRKKLLKSNDALINIHYGCRNVILKALGIKEMERSGIFIAGWYIGGFLLAYSIRIVRRSPDSQSLIILILSLLLIILLAISGLRRGHLKNKISKEERKSEK